MTSPKTSVENKASAVRFLVALALFCCATTTSAQTLPRVFALDPVSLSHAKARIAKQDKALLPALERLRREADEALRVGPFTVTAKQRVPPSGDKHDYLTLAPYWWPDPSKPDGLPYIRRDGELNPESKRDTDNPKLNGMADAVETLSLAYYFTGEEKYADRAAVLLRVWFIEKATKMNPNYEYAQAVMGRNNGRGAGLIDARKFIQVVDSIGLLAASRGWTKSDQQGVQDWFRAFVKWLQTSANGKEEAAARNNHGSWFAATFAAFALFIGDEALARKTVEAVKTRITWQIEPDGRQPLELDRTRGMSYSLFNLNALLTVATIGDKLGINLWAYQTKDGRSIRKAFDYLAPFVFDGKEWPHKQIIKWSPEDYFALLRRTASKFRDGALLAKVPPINPADRDVLLYGDGRVVTQQPATEKIRFADQIEAYLKADEVKPPSQDGILFIGSSIFRLWKNLPEHMAPLPVFNRAFGGSRTAEILQHMDKIVLPYKPKIVVYYCGSNDINADIKPEEIVANFKEFAKRVHAQLPQTKIFFVSINRAPQKMGRWGWVDDANQRAKELSEKDKRLGFIDVNPALFDKDGKPRMELYLPDKLHFQEPAYDEFTKIIKPVIEKAWQAWKK